MFHPALYGVVINTDSVIICILHFSSFRCLSGGLSSADFLCTWRYVLDRPRRRVVSWAVLNDNSFFCFPIEYHWGGGRRWGRRWGRRSRCCEQRRGAPCRFLAGRLLGWRSMRRHRCWKSGKTCAKCSPSDERVVCCRIAVNQRWRQHPVLERQAATLTNTSRDFWVTLCRCHLKVILSQGDFQMLQCWFHTWHCFLHGTYVRVAFMQQFGRRWSSIEKDNVWSWDPSPFKNFTTVRRCSQWQKTILSLTPRVLILDTTLCWVMWKNNSTRPPNSLIQRGAHLLLRILLRFALGWQGGYCFFFVQLIGWEKHLCPHDVSNNKHATVFQRDHGANNATKTNTFFSFLSIWNPLRHEWFTQTIIL